MPLIRRLSLLLVLLATSCQKHEPVLPTTPARRQLDLSERIFAAIPQAARANDVTQVDAALALAEIVVPGYAPRLRLIVSGDNPLLAQGAAVALVRIRMRRAPGKATLEECVQAETSPFVREECARQLVPPVAPPEKPATVIAASLESRDVERHRTGLRQLLRASPTTGGDEAVLRALTHLIDDGDLQVRLLTNAAFLRRSLQQDPPPADPVDR